MDMTTGSLSYAGLVGYYWASPAYLSTLSAYNLSFNSANVFPSTYSARWYGFTVQPTTTKFQVLVSA